VKRQRDIRARGKGFNEAKHVSLDGNQLHGVQDDEARGAGVSDLDCALDVRSSFTVPTG
jgi:hypothetical protein